MELTFNGANICLGAVYMRREYLKRVNFHQFQKVLGELEIYMTKYSSQHRLILGDFNCFFRYEAGYAFQRYSDTTNQHLIEFQLFQGRTKLLQHNNIPNNYKNFLDLRLSDIIGDKIEMKTTDPILMDQVIFNIINR